MGNSQMEKPIKPAVLDKIQRLRLMDDELMTACFSDDLECTQLILQIILGKPDLTVKSSRTQVTLKNLQGRSLRLDVLAQDASGMYTNVEVQRASKGANPRRARYHGSLLDSNVVEPGENFEKIPETYIIFITEEDFFGEGLPVYRVKKTLEGTDLPFEDGMHVIYVNGTYRGEDRLGELMHDFSCSNPDDMYFKALADQDKGRHSPAFDTSR